VQTSKVTQGCRSEIACNTSPTGALRLHRRLTNRASPAESRRHCVKNARALAHSSRSPHLDAAFFSFLEERYRRADHAVQESIRLRTAKCETHQYRMARWRASVGLAPPVRRARVALLEAVPPDCWRGGEPLLQLLSFRGLRLFAKHAPMLGCFEQRYTTRFCYRFEGLSLALCYVLKSLECRLHRALRLTAERECGTFLAGMPLSPSRRRS
jgi:hypothetical protein